MVVMIIASAIVAVKVKILWKPILNWDFDDSINFDKRFLAPPPNVLARAEQSDPKYFT
jgi:hypothetical protein